MILRLFGNYIVAQLERNFNTYNIFCEFFVKNCCPLLTTLVSGSPIIQNGRLVGALTHVMINDPHPRLRHFHLKHVKSNRCQIKRKGNIIPQWFDTAFSHFDDLYFSMNCVGVIPMCSLNCRLKK